MSHKNVVDGINASDKIFLTKIMNKFKVSEVQQYKNRITPNYFTAYGSLRILKNAIELCLIYLKNMVCQIRGKKKT